jgi:hypothetical protein
MDMLYFLLPALQPAGRGGEEDRPRAEQIEAYEKAIRYIERWFKSSARKPTEDISMYYASCSMRRRSPRIPSIPTWL